MKNRARSGRLPRLFEVALVAGLAALILWWTRGRGGAWTAWLPPALFLYLPLGALLLTDRDFDGTALVAPPARKAASDLAGYLFIILPLFLLGYWIYASFYLGLHFRPRLPPRLFELVVWQLLGVALPEEVFFRGWLQGRLNRVLGLRFRLLGAQIGPALFIAAGLFALFHLINVPHAGRLTVFFPGMLFGLYRERTRSVAVPVLAHGAGNLVFMIAQQWAQ